MHRSGSAHKADSVAKNIQSTENSATNSDSLRQILLSEEPATLPPDIAPARAVPAVARQGQSDVVVTRAVRAGQ